MTEPVGPNGSPNGVAQEPTTASEWLAVLTRRMDLRRLTVLMLKSYVDGNAPLPEMTADTRESWAAFQRRARTNWGELICDSVVDRCVPNGISIGGDIKSPKAKAAQKIWRDNRMKSVFNSWLRYGLIFGQSYLTVWRGSATGSGPIITADSPETMAVVTDPLQHWKPRAALKVWRDIENGVDFAMVWSKGNNPALFRRGSYVRVETRIIESKWLVNLAEGAWEQVNADAITAQFASAPIPVVVYNNPGGHGDFETHIDLINRINLETLERLVITAMQAFRQRIIEGGLLPERDDQGNVIDYTKTFAPAPGALWNLPKELTLKETQVADVSGLLLGSKESIRQLSAVTRTPLPMLMPDNANISAEGAQATEAGHIFRCSDRLSEAKLGAEAAMTMACQVAGQTFDDDEFVEVNFEEVDRVTFAEKYNAALAAHNAGESWSSICRNVLGYSPEQIEQDRLDRIAEALLAASIPPVPTRVGEELTGNAPGTAPPTSGTSQMYGDKPAPPPPTAQGAPNGQQPQPQAPQRAIGGASSPSPNSGGAQPGGRPPARTRR